MLIFKIGKPVVGSELIGRKEEAESLYSYATGGQSVILSAPRRYGKTSLLFEVLERARKNGYSVGYLDIFEAVSLRELTEKTVETLLINDKLPVRKFLGSLKKDIKKVLSSMEFKAILENYEFVFSLSQPNIDEMELFDDALDFIEAYGQKKGGKLIFVIDEFSDLLKWNSKLLKKMRSKFQRHRNVTYLFAGSQESLMRDIFTRKSFAFYGFGVMMDIAPIAEEEFISYIYNKFTHAGFKIPKEVAAYIVNCMGSHPHYTKLLGQTVADLVSEKKDIDRRLVEKAFDIALLRIRGELDKEWEILLKCPLQRRILKILAKEKMSPYKSKELNEKEKRQLYFALTELEKKGILRKVRKGEYTFYNPFFERYIELLDRSPKV